MNKKLLFGIMSLAALAACSDMNDLESKNIADEAVSPVQFEIINDNVATRASMDGDKIVWNANEGDIFTLYHGAARTTPGAITGYQNASYTANANEGGAASLTTPTMILPGSAIMVWPADTTFRIKSGDNLTIQIPVVQGGKVDGKEIIQHQIPYVSDLINIQNYAAYSETGPGIPTAYKTAGKGRKYQIYMRPMASQLNLKADYGTTESQIAALYEGAAGVDAGEGIDSIKVTSVDLLTTTTGNKFTTKIPLQFAVPTAAQGANWPTVTNNIWDQVTNFNVGGIAPADQVDKLTTKCLLDKNKGCKFLILPQANIGGTGVTEGAVVVNTTYGKVVVAPSTFVTNKGKYSATEIADAWYRITKTAVPAATAVLYNETAATAAETSGEFAGQYKTTADVMHGMAQVIDAFSTNTVTSATSKVQGEPTGAKGTRYVKVLLTYLDMTDLHVKDDKQLRNAAKVWKQMNLDDVTVYLDGNANNEFEISQKTIDKINEINASIAGGLKSFKVKPCKVGGEVCNTIVITGGGNIKDLTFIKDNAGTKAVVAFKAGETWKWSTNNTVKVANTACGISKFVNRGTFTSDATATINVKNDLATPAWVNMPFENAEGATWNISGATLNVQFNVTNYGTVNIAKGAQYRQDGQAGATTFINEATAIPGRFTGGNDAKIGKVENKGVFATVSAGVINNYGLIEHADKDAKTYITANDNGGAGFGTAFGAANKMGRINLPYSNKNEDNVSVSAALNTGFVSVTVDGEVTGALDASVVGNKVNYVIVNSGVTEIKAVSDQVKYLEINQPRTEIAWNVPTTTEYDGLIVLSDVNIKLGTKIVATVTYLGADMYVGGKFNQAALAAEGTDPAYAATNFNGYFGNTTGNVGSKYITY